MDPITTLPNAALRAGDPFSDACLARGLTTFHAACHWVHQLPYGANSRVDDAMLLFAEQRGTCFSKHGVIARIAARLGLDVHKNLGFYRLDDEIITGVGDILRPHGLTFVPSIHCFLEHGASRVDLTEGNRTGKNRDIDQFDFVVRVEPEISRDELQRIHSIYLAKYAAIEPRLASIGEDAVRQLLLTCHQAACCSSKAVSQAVTVATA